MTQWVDALRKMDMCAAEGQNSAESDTAAHLSMLQAWNACPRGDWLLWIIAKTTGDKLSDDLTNQQRRQLVRATSRCAYLGLDIYEFWFPDNLKPRNTLELCTRYGKSDPDVTIKDMKKAALEAQGYAPAYFAAECAYVTTEYSKGSLARSAMNAAYYIIPPSTLPGDWEEREPVLLQCAEIVHEEYPNPRFDLFKAKWGVTQGITEGSS